MTETENILQIEFKPNNIPETSILMDKNFNQRESEKPKYS